MKVKRGEGELGMGILEHQCAAITHRGEEKGRRGEEREKEGRKEKGGGEEKEEKQKEDIINLS